MVVSSRVDEQGGPVRQGRVGVGGPVPAGRAAGEHGAVTALAARAAAGGGGGAARAAPPARPQRVGRRPEPVGIVGVGVGVGVGRVVVLRFRTDDDIPRPGPAPDTPRMDRPETSPLG